MLRTDLIDVVNTGHAWAFVGSGPSIESGLPAWRQLVENSLKATADARRDEITADSRFNLAFRDSHFDRCFSIIEKHTDRAHLEKVVEAQLGTPSTLSRTLEIVAEWPFAGYVTTNYDDLLERALEQTAEPGWISIGNSEDELRKVSGDPRDVVWHVHGGIHLRPDRSHLILTEHDYDAVYLEGSPLERQIRSLLTQRRFVFIGFGF